MTRRFWMHAAAIVSLGLTGLSGVQALAQTVTPSPTVLTFTPSPVGVTGSGVQKGTITFQITNGTGFIPATAVLHYGTSFSAAPISCTGTGNPNETCTVLISFVPSLPGGRRDALFLMNGTTRLATVLIYGVGQSPLGMIQPGVVTQPIKGSTAIFTSVVDENGTAYALETQVPAVVKVTAAGVVTTLPITGLNSPRTIGIDGAGVLYIAGEAVGGPLITYDTVQGTQGTFAVPNASHIFADIAVGNTGKIYAIDGTANVLYTIAPSGTTQQAFSPAIGGPASMTVDSSENLFIGGQTTVELAAGVAPQTQTQINASNSQNGLSIDAAGTLYATPFSGGLGMTELPSPYTTAQTVLDPTATAIGGSEGPDGTVYVGTAGSLDKVDRTQGLVAFGNNTIGNQTVAIYNGGNQSLTISNIALTGSSAFALGTASTNNCTGGSTMLPGGFCNVQVTYSTTHAGVFSGTLTITDNSLNSATSTHTVAITAEFQGIYVTASPTLLNFGNQAIGTTSATQQVTFTNNGDFYSANLALPQNTGPFIVTAGTCVTPLLPLAVGASCTMNVAFAPTLLTQVYTGGTTGLSALASFQFGTMPVTFFVNATAISPAAAVGSFAPGSLAFGTQVVNTTSPTQPLLLTNTGNAQLNLTSISITGTNLLNFSETNTCGGGLAPNASCTINVSFSPSAVGPYSATVSVVDNAAVSPTTATLTGTGVALQAPQLQFTPAQLSPIAGTGVGKVLDTGDGGAALQATFNTPFGIAQDASGNIYVSDQDANYVRKIDANGNITAFAGSPTTGSGSFGGDGGLATAAHLSQPIGIAIDGAGNVYIADYGNGRIRKVTVSTGIITTYAGVGNGFFNGGPSTTVPLPGPQGIAFDAAGNLYVACTNQQIIAKITPGTTPSTSLFAGVLTGPGPGVNSYNGDNILAINADLNFPNDVATDLAGNVYIADTVNYRVRKVAASTGIITTVAGTGTQGSTGDSGQATSAQINANGIATNLAGEIYINTGSTIRKVDINGVITTIAGGGTGSLPGPATSVLLNGLGLARADRYGDLLLPDYQGYDGVLEAGPKGILVFPSQPIGTVSAPQTVIFENTGNTSLTLNQVTYTASASFNVTGGTCISQTTLAPAGTCTLTVTFAPTTAGGVGPYTSSIPVASNSVGGATSILLQGTATAAVAAPAVTITPNPDAFSPSPVGIQEGAPTPMSLTNSGNAPLTINSINITGTNASSFSQTNNCPASLAAAASCSITVLFTPTTSGALTANISVADNAAVTPTLATLTGTGTAPPAPAATLSPNPLSFPNTVVGVASAPMLLTLTNGGTAALTSPGYQISSGSFNSVSSTCGPSLAAGASCTFSIVFTPLTVGPLTATFTYSDNASGSPHTATFTGTGTAAPAPQAVLSPSPLAFPSTTVGIATTLPLVLSNPGTAVLNITSITVTGTNASNFTFTNGCSASLAAGANCTLNVTFTPTSVASFTAAISVSDNATGSPHTATLTGTGTAPPVATVAPLSPLNFANTGVGSTATALPITVSNTGGATLTGISFSLTGTNPGDFATTSASTCGTTLAAGASCVIDVSFTPASAATFTATLSLSDSASGSPQTATITGTGIIVAATYTVASSTPLVSVQPGGLAQYNLTIAPVGGTYSNLVTLSASGLPAGAVATFLPPAVTPGSAGAPSVLSIQTPSLLARERGPDPQRPGPVPLMAVLSGASLLGLIVPRRLRKASRRWMLLAIAALSILPVLAMSGCSGGYFGPVPKTFTVTVTGTSGAIQQTTTVSLTVQ